MIIPEIYTGTAGWSYDDWVPSFYPFGQSKEFSWLKFYSRYFNAVEVNSTYYTYHPPNIVANWIRQIDEGSEFLFTIKLHQDFTHKRRYGKDQINTVRTYLDLLSERQRLGGLLLQFPYSFDCNEANIEYLREVIEIFEGYDRFVEVRHSSWKGKRASTVTFCSIDQPVIGSSIDFTPSAGNGAAYIRFHGRNAEAWKRSIANYGKKQTYEEQSARYDYLYSPGELTEIGNKVKEIFDKIKKVFIIMNNHPHGNAVANAFELLHLLKNGAKVEVPKTILNAYPRLKNISLN